MRQCSPRLTQPEFDGLVHWVIHHAARQTPDTLSSRLEEEWLADLAFRASTLSRLRFAVGVCWATIVIVNDFPRSRVPAMSPAATAKGSITPIDYNFGYFSLRSATLFLIVGIHAALFCGLITTLPHMRGIATPAKLHSQVLGHVDPTSRNTVAASGKGRGS